MTDNIFISLSLMIAFGMLFGRVAKFFHLPNVTGYLVGGLLLGPSVLNIVTEQTLEGFNIISEVALGFIAFSIGNEFKISYFKRVGITPIVIAVFEALFAVVFVVIGLYLAGNSLPFSLVLGSIAAATAPAATIMVIKQYQAKGKVTETLLSVVAIDDAVALMLFGISVAVAQSLTSSSASVLSSLLSPVIEIFGSLLLGAVLGILFTFPLRWFKKDGNRLSITIGFVFLAAGISQILDFSALLVCMAMGATLTNFSSQTKHIMKLTDSITPPIFMLFFVTSGAELKLSVLPAIGVSGIIYVVLRVIGKMFGAYFGASICKADEKIRKYIGPALVPQAGVAIGLSLLATTVVPEHGQTIRAIILCGTLIYEIIGPVLSKLALKKAGEIE